MTDQEDRTSWLPVHLLHQENLRSQRQYGYRHRLKSSPPGGEPLVHPVGYQHSKSRSKLQQRSKCAQKWAAPGGAGMQAIFLDSKAKSRGTGVFLPQTDDIDFQLNNKPACSPILLPARVVQVLNLNVHELQLQIHSQDVTQKSKDSNNSQVNGKKKRRSCVIYQRRNSSQQIFLPKEWIY